MQTIPELLAMKDPIAVEGFKLGLETVEIVLDTLLKEIQALVVLDAQSKTPKELMSSLMRLTVQKQTIEGLRDALPRIILQGDVAAIGMIL